MSRIIEAAREARERIHAYVQKNPGLLAEDIWFNNARLNKKRVIETLRYLDKSGAVRKEGSRQAARFFAV